MEVTDTLTPAIAKLFPAFEKCHPKQLRWTKKFKMEYLEQEGNYAYWLVNDDKAVVGEALLRHKSDSCVEIDGYTVLPEHQGKGYGNVLIGLCFEQMKAKGYEYVTGEAREGASVNTFKRFGAEIVCPQKNWGGTGETYYSFKLALI